MGSSVLILSLVAASSMGATVTRSETKLQEEVFDRWWNEDFEWKFKKLPVKGKVPKSRIPYSGNIYLDKEGGTTNVMRKYDEALNRGYPATAWEQADTAEARSGGRRRGLFRRAEDNGWFGHCNGWSSAAIRHAEPEKSVRAYGRIFTPADIKGLLAEVYMYNDVEMLAGLDTELNPGSLHAILANWIGRGSHPVVMDSDPGKEKWNYPIYSYSSSHGRHSSRQVEVRTNIAYSKDTEDGEHNSSPAIRKFKSFHYMLDLDARGHIIGGYYFNDSSRIDFLWIPLSPKQSGEAGNESGNPHIDVNKVMNIWRQSVSTDTRRKWLVIDPLAKDRTVEVEDPTLMLPRNIRIVPPRRRAEPVSTTAAE